MLASARGTRWLPTVVLWPVFLASSLLALVFPWVLLPLILPPILVTILGLSPARPLVEIPPVRPTVRPWSPPSPRGPPTD